MNFKEAIEALLAGKKIRDVCWTGDYVYLNNGKLTAEDGRTTDVSILFCDTGKYEIVEPPKKKKKKKKKLYQAVYNEDGIYTIDDRLFESEEEAKAYSPDEFVKLIGEPIEVEVDDQ